MAINKLTDIECRNATVPAGKKTLKLGDGAGLFLFITKAIKSWRVNYTSPTTGKPDVFVIGQYPSPVNLAEARAERDRVKELVHAGFDPKVAKREDKAERIERCSGEQSVMGVTDTWMERQNWSPDVRQQRESMIMKYMLNHHLPERGTTFGHLYVGDVTVNDVLSCLRSIEAQGVLTQVRRCRQIMEQVFNQVSVRTMRQGLENPAANLKAELKVAVTNGGFTELPESELGSIVRSLDQNATARGLHPVTIAAVRFYLLVISRPGMLCSMAWDDIEWGARRWVIPADKMKGKRNGREDHIIPLSNQAFDLLLWIKDQEWHDEWVFPNSSTQAGKYPQMSGNLLATTFRRMDFGCHPHGLRKTFSTILNENEFNRDHIEAHLDHVKSDVRSIYNKALYLRQRGELMQWWADFLDAKAYGQPAPASNVVELKREVA